MKKVLVTGAKGQLGSCFKEIDDNFKNKLSFHYTSKGDLDITNSFEVESYFMSYKFDFCINCAAYTAVDRAENDQENAYKINVEGVKNIVKSCKEHNTTLIHISTDFVFDGKSNHPYNEEGSTNPISIYGKTKLEGEKVIISEFEKYYIIRTSWLYSEFGNNFVKTMLKLADSRSQLEVINDQIGTPTYAKNLAEVILKLINKKKTDFGIYNYSNEGVASWYDFAKAVFEIKDKNIKVEAIPTKSFPTPAKRPPFSILNKTKIKQNLELEIPYWRDSLRICLDKI